MRITIPWQHDIREVRDWLFENAGKYGRDWAIDSRYVGYEEAGALEHTARIDDEKIATAFILRWT